ncbi:MAG: T9SS type A sorting domain-containing protein [Bacteroidetes bacterium]|nr:T9SS type A sorting domain-containing protein [Bacteroidota bacterium]
MKSIVAILFLFLAPAAGFASGVYGGPAAPVAGPGPAFTLNPNPVNGNFFYVHFNFAESEFPDTRLIISNVLGQVVYTSPVKKTEFASGSIRIELSDAKLDKGVYFVQLKSGENTKTQKLAVR